MHRANAAATLRAYRTGWAQWCAYCDEYGHAPLAGRPEPVSFFLAHLSRTKRLATVRSRLAAIAAAHRVAGIELDTRHRFIRAVLRGLQREQSDTPARQAAPLLFEVLPRFLAAFPGLTIERSLTHADGAALARTFVSLRLLPRHRGLSTRRGDTPGKLGVPQRDP